MKVAEMMDSLSANGGGVSIAVITLTAELRKLAVNGTVVGLLDGLPPVFDFDWIQGFAANSGASSRLRWSDRLLHWLIESEIDLVHTHAIWTGCSITNSRWHRRTKKPYLVSPHGMLDRWALANSAWRKRIAAAFFENRHLREARCVHALCSSELESVRAYGLKNPVCIVSNGVDLVDSGTLTTGTWTPEKEILLFLGRLHPKKGLMNALRAWKQVLHATSKIQKSESHEWRFVVAGWDQGGHKADLQRLCDELGLVYTDIPAATFVDETLPLPDTASVVFLGPVFGEQKDQLLRRASAFILPSFSEGLPMSILEAWSYQLPILMTEHCNLPEGFAAGAALRIGTDAGSIGEGLRALFSLPRTDNGQPTTSLASIGRNGRALVERQFTWPQVAAQMKEVYEWVLGGGERPGSVVD
jgi:poly(glycerol-phosphate) alpha-glucosyltransferase